MSGPRPRWNNDLQPGSAFHEIVVLPALAPHLARPYNNGLPVPANDGLPAYAPNPPAMAPLEAAAAAAAPPVIDLIGSDESGGEDGIQVLGDPVAESNDVDADDLDDEERQFFLLVYTVFNQLTPSGRGNSMKKTKIEENKQLPGMVPVLSITRSKFIELALSAHGYQDMYTAGPISGPPFSVYWTGSTGGKRGAPSVGTDLEWAGVQQRLLTTKSTVTSVSVMFNLDQMNGWKTTRKRPLSPSPELTYGTRVPHVESFTPEDRVTGQIVEEIKSTWICDNHNGSCFIGEDAQHIPLNRFRLKQWASALRARPDLLKVSGAPPEELLQEWRPELLSTSGSGRSASASGSVSTPVRPRGRNGPYPIAPSPAAPAFQFDPNALLGLMAPLATVAMKALEQSPERASASRSREHMSSPPPALEDELSLCLQAFGRAKRVDADAVMTAVEALGEAGYEPETIAVPSAGRIQELTGLSEGKAHQLQRFAADWSEKVANKRARRE
ncbi:hypothetical protein EIP91_006803 [Steccherinum ochraceum]|uniref:Uncharacterized protein n=1 Tax=Steccherinum ochraceum TaxID=92696 RepID=A0A4R0R5A3_9APHY|nr:hypothetical protein EIP91_006803 [Steccherinum ochraceum]